MAADGDSVPQVDSRFGFQPRVEPIDWQDAQGASSADVCARLRGFARMVALGQLEREEGDVNAPPAMIKAFDLLQLSAQYATHCDDQLALRVRELRLRRAQLQEQLAQREREQRQRRRQMAVHRAECRRLDALAELPHLSWRVPAAELLHLVSAEGSVANRALFLPGSEFSLSLPTPNTPADREQRLRLRHGALRDRVEELPHDHVAMHDAAYLCLSESLRPSLGFGRCPGPPR